MTINPAYKEEEDYGDGEPYKIAPPAAIKRTVSLANNQVKLAFEIHLYLLTLQKFASFEAAKLFSLQCSKIIMKTS